MRLTSWTFGGPGRAEVIAYVVEVESDDGQFREQTIVLGVEQSVNLDSLENSLYALNKALDK